MRIGVLLYIILGVLLSAQAQRRQIGEARTILKSGKNYDKAEKLMTDLLKDSSNHENKRIYEIWLQSVEKQYEQANERFYMKKQQDTAQFFALVKRMFTIAFRLDSLDARPDKKGRSNPGLRERMARRMNTYRPNLFSGGSYYLNKNDLTKAYDFFETYIGCARQPLFTGYKLDSVDTRLPEAAYWSTYVGYRSQDPVLTLRYHKNALADHAKADYTLQYTAEAWRWLKDDSMYVATLCEGFERYPKSKYFFPRLMDSYTQKGCYAEALKLVDKALEVDSTSEFFIFAKSVVLLNMEQYAQSLEYTNKLIANDTKIAEAYFNAGRAYLNIALRMDSKRHKKQIKKMYQQAQKPLEHYRKIAPQEKQKWGPALYRVYFNLNMGKQFDEIDKILKK